MRLIIGKTLPVEDVLEALAIDIGDTESVEDQYWNTFDVNDGKGTFIAVYPHQDELLSSFARRAGEAPYGNLYTQYVGFLRAWVSANTKLVIEKPAEAIE